MPEVDTVRRWQGATMVDRDGDRVGAIESSYVDDQSGAPEWALVKGTPARAGTAEPPCPLFGAPLGTGASLGWRPTHG
jgi:hypothetical protein